MDIPGVKPHTCIINVGLYRSGTTTVIGAAKLLGLKTYREFPGPTKDQHREFLYEPERSVREWISTGGLEEVLRIAATHDIICDGWITLLPFLAPVDFANLCQEARRAGIQLEFVGQVGIAALDGARLGRCSRS